MNMSAIEQEVLLTAAEECELWQVITGLRAKLGSGSDDELRGVAWPIVREFVARGWVRLSRRPVLAGEPIAQWTPIPPADVDAILADPESWAVSPALVERRTHDEVFIHLTPAGKNVVEHGALDEAYREFLGTNAPSSKPPAIQ